MAAPHVVKEVDAGLEIATIVVRVDELPSTALCTQLFLSLMSKRHLNAGVYAREELRCQLIFRLPVSSWAQCIQAVQMPREQCD